MDSNHRFLVVSQESSPLDHGTILLLKAEAVRLELTSEMYSPPVFKTGSLNRSDTLPVGPRTEVSIATTAQKN